MDRKVLILGPTFFGYNYSIERAFRALGWQTEVMEYDEPIHPFTPKNMVLHKLFPHSRALREKSRRAFNALALQKAEIYRPDLIFIYNGDILESETVRRFREKSKVAVWMLDGAFRHPDSVAIAPEVDAYFCFENSDVEKLESFGVNASFLPQGYDPEVYYPLSLERDIDILFVGALYGYPERIRLLTLLAEQLGRQYIIKVYGRYKPIFKNPLKWMLREKRNIFMNKNVLPAEVNRLYNRAKVCINIHHAQSVEGANPKVFEICGAGAFQVVDYNPFIASIYPDNEVAMFHSDEDFLYKITESLSTDVSTRREAAYQIVARYHTFEQRIRQALKILSFSTSPILP